MGNLFAHAVSFDTAQIHADSFLIFDILLSLRSRRKKVAHGFNRGKKIAPSPFLSFYSSFLIFRSRHREP